jgi:hypothetical protein
VSATTRLNARYRVPSTRAGNRYTGDECPSFNASKVPANSVSSAAMMRQIGED